ncbi:response regulator receiver modulated diguanylate cyclase/phosphodiesterase [[Leptolyngbya] sp. PCC 7376]|uniref:two-component system response regulator n=1 Tax=[Leptolyngbya] sp. PCC 7376 TaxID=111781 RepID=UPI00029F243F|nr:EAL domain-containing protein [[Leptolyngbya] sp. PCC 7376]AFY37359.1 response regulator receiver modulated diguanylate cyclase/phosphodiesterase [[Leptolyngbya] sp. PCC 7376]
MTTILIIEDDDIVRKLVRKILTQEGYKVMEASDGNSGTKLAQENQPDLIVCDIMMPQLNGYQVLELLQCNQETEAIPFIFLTAKAEKQYMRQGMQLGADDYLTKPFTKNELLGAVSARLTKYSSLKQRYAGSPGKDVDAQLSQRTNRDALTNLPTQLALRDLFNQIVQASAKSSKNKSGDGPKTPSVLPVFCISLDRFQRVIATLGYESATALFQAIAQRIKDIVSTQGVVVRLSGDDFCAILKAVDNKQSILNFAQELIDSFKEPFTLEDQKIFVGISVGIAIYPRDNLDIRDLLQNANKAMLKSRQKGGNQYQLFTAAFNVGKSNLITLETDLRYAIQREEIEVHYQPKMDLQTGKIKGSEALLRWYHPERGAVPPNQFLPLAEEIGLIEEIGEFVLNQSCRQLKIWQNTGLNTFQMSVNLSARQFNQLNLHQRLSRILIDNSIEPEHLELELTESTLVQNAEVAVRRLKALKTLGVAIAIDDFGTGYSSLSYLQQFPFDVLKIDRSFVKNIHLNKANSAIITAIITMAHQLGLKVIAEGVESQEELDFLKKHDCDAIQGFLFSYAVSAKEFSSSPFMSNDFQSDLI